MPVPFLASHMNMPALTAATLLLGLISGSGISVSSSAKPSAHLFDYDRAKPLDVRVVSTEQRESAGVRDVTYAAYDSRHGRIAAYIVSPRQPGASAGILYFHWLGEPRGDRSQFLEEAMALAPYGVVSVLIQGYFPWHIQPKDGASDRAEVVAQVIDARRGMDLLLAQPGVDPKRIAYVGHDYGAMFGSIVAGVEKRARAFVMMAGMGNFGDWSLKYWKQPGAQGEATYRAALADVDPLGYIGEAAPAALLFQFSRKDTYIAEPVATEFFERASEPKGIKWYDAEHDLRTEEAGRDRRAWLVDQLKLSDSPQPSAPGQSATAPQ